MGTTTTAVPVGLTAPELDEAMATPGTYTLDVPGTVELDQLVTMLRRLAGAHGNHASGIVRVGRTLWVDVAALGVHT